MILIAAVLIAGFIEVKELPAPLPDDPAAAAWAAVNPAPVRLTPQRSVRLNDKQANELSLAAAPETASLRAAVAGDRLALLIEWSDATEDFIRPDSTDVFGDAAAVQFPLRFGKGLRLPFVGMGDEEMPVALFHQRATPGGSASRQAVAAGFGSTTRAELGEVRTAMRYDRERKAWRALFVLPLSSPSLDLRQGLVPFALALWDGAKHERGGNKALSAWQFLRLARHPLDEAYAREMSAAEPGDAARGKLLVESICTPCHIVGDKRLAAPGLAPELSSIGAIASPAYLRQSLIDPSAVIVPGLTARAEAFTWFKLDAQGKHVSKMQSFQALPPADLSAIVAYLETLGSKP